MLMAVPKGSMKPSERNECAMLTVWNPAANSKMVILDTYLEDACYLAYQQHHHWLHIAKELGKVGYWLESVRVYFTAYNVYCFTKL